MPRSLKRSSLFVLLLSVFLWIFFDQSKHLPLLAVVSPFGEDPYDAVGSFGVQLASLSALLSLVRAFRPYPIPATQSSQASLLRGQWVAILAVAVTLLADLIAMFRYSSIWRASLPGLLLAVSLGFMILMTLWVSRNLTQNRASHSMEAGSNRWPRAWIIMAAGTLILSLYPISWREDIAGGVLAAALGMFILFMETWALATAILPGSSRESDVLDDLLALHGWLKEESLIAASLFRPLETLAGSVSIRRAWGWIHPRRHVWRLILMAGLLMGLGLALAESLVEGASANLHTALLVLAIFITLEGSAVILGWLLFSRYLGLFREEG
jgi:hypothetical protein